MKMYPVAVSHIKNQGSYTEEYRKKINIDPYYLKELNNQTGF
jgi:hypothetical protein